MTRTTMAWAVTSALGLVTAASAGIQTETETFNFSIPEDQFEATFSVNGFDSLGGTRQLLGFTIGLEATLDTTIVIDNESPFAVPSDTWAYLPGHVNFFQIDNGMDGGGEEGLRGGSNSIFFGLGGPAFDGITGALAADDGDAEPGPFPEAQPDGPDAMSVSYSGFFSSIILEDGPSALQFVTDAPVLNGRISPFFFPEFFHPANGAQLTSQETITETGTLTITYQYAVVPAPGAGALLLAGLGTMLRRRRR